MVHVTSFDRKIRHLNSNNQLRQMLRVVIIEVVYLFNGLKFLYKQIHLFFNEFQQLILEQHLQF